LVCFYGLLVLLSSLCLVVEKHITRLVIVLISLFLSRLNNWKLILGGSISSSNRVIGILEFLILLGTLDIMVVANRELGITNAIAPGQISSIDFRRIIIRIVLDKNFSCSRVINRTMIISERFPFVKPIRRLSLLRIIYWL
jgi:hypothetical protein